MSFELTTAKTIRVAPTKAFSAFTDGPTWSSWFSDNTSVDLRVGGRFKNDDGDTGEYLEIQKDRLLRFTWEGSFAGSEIELRFDDRGADGTDVSLRHYKLATQADADKMKTCWRWTLDNLASFLEDGRPIGMSEWKATQPEAAL